eukprot:g5589.t1
MLLSLLALLVGPVVALDQGDVCVGCTVAMSLASEGAVLEIEKAALALCKNSTACTLVVTALAKLAQSGVSPDKACTTVKLCDGTCKLYPDQWPVKTPPSPPVWPPSNHTSAAATAALLPPAPMSPATLRDARAIDGIAAVEQLFGALGRRGAGRAGTATFFTVVSRVVRFLGCLKAAGAGAAGECLADTAGGDARALAARRARLALDAGAPGLDPCGLNVSCIVDRFGTQHLPIFDADGDGYSAAPNGTLRGWHWRGRDCNDKDTSVYPGRAAAPADPTVDHDCNGIAGANASGPYEDQLCAGTPRRGLVVLGDSAGAHFHVPPRWLTARGWRASDLLAWPTVGAAEDELDRPDCSWGTGFRSMEQCPYPHGFATASMYQRLRARNRCNHRDYQNLGVNGMRITQVEHLVNATSRVAAEDHPALVMFALLGNDVCNGHADTEAHWTPVDEFRADAWRALRLLDARLPAGSHVAALGLVDGRVLYENMHALQHPLGPSYDELYGFLNCLGINPCYGWLNSNTTLRDATTAHAMALNAVYDEIATSQNFSNFKLIVHQPDWRKYIAEYVAAGGAASDLIEPVDGFHPSQAGNMYLAQSLWSYLEDNYPEALGAVNPHNAEIERLFGEQGGH